MTLLPTSEIPGGFIVPNDTHIGEWQKTCGKLDHDEFLVPFAVSRLKPGDFVIDCGAFDGDHTIAYSKAVGEMGRVLAIEAGQLAFNCLKHNIAMFRILNVIALRGAVGNINGEYAQHVTNENLGASTCLKVDSMHDASMFTISIDHIMRGLKMKVDFIKLDIEGWEPRALAGAATTLQTDRPELLIEINRGALEKCGFTPGTIFCELTGFRYSWKIVQDDCDVDSPQYDIHCLPL